MSYILVIAIMHGLYSPPEIKVVDTYYRLSECEAIGEAAKSQAPDSVSYRCIGVQ